MQHTGIAHESMYSFTRRTLVASTFFFSIFDPEYASLLEIKERYESTTYSFVRLISVVGLSGSSSALDSTSVLNSEPNVPLRQYLSGYCSQVYSLALRY